MGGPSPAPSLLTHPWARGGGGYRPIPALRVRLRRAMSDAEPPALAHTALSRSPHLLKISPVSPDLNKAALEARLRDALPAQDYRLAVAYREGVPLGYAVLEVADAGLRGATAARLRGRVVEGLALDCAPVSPSLEHADRVPFMKAKKPPAPPGGGRALREGGAGAHRRSLQRGAQPGHCRVLRGLCDQVLRGATPRRQGW